VCEASCHISDCSCETVSCFEMQVKTEIVLLKANIHQNDIQRSLKSSRQQSHKEKQKKRQKGSTRHEREAYPKIVELNVPTTPRCNVRC